MSQIHTKLLAAILFWMVVFTFGAEELQAAEFTYIVGTCIKGTNFTRIQDALNATPSPNVVKVCPNTYHEQVLIVKPVTLEGIRSGNEDQAIIAPPSGGLIVNAIDDFGSSVAAQVLVLATTGVNLSNLVIDASGNNFSSTIDYMAGIYYEDSAGTVNHVVTQNQANKHNGIGILLEGGSSNPSVTVENSIIHDFDRVGIWTETNSKVSELTATITGNDLIQNTPNPVPSGISNLYFASGSTVTATTNYVDGSPSGEYCVGLAGAGGTVSGNIIANCTYGFYENTDGAMKANSNKVINSETGAYFNTSVKTTEFQDNVITFSDIAIQFGVCSAIASVKSNTIIAAGVGVNGPAPAQPNTYIDVFGLLVKSCR